MLSKMFWQAYISARHLAPDLRELDRFRELNPREAVRDLSIRLMRQVHYFGNREDALPEWHDAAQIRDPLELWRHWHELPIVTKQMLQTQFDAREIQRRFGLAGYLSASGGSTGEPTPFLHDPGMRRACLVNHLYARMKMGWRPGMPTIAIWGAHRDSLRDRISAWCRNDWGVVGFKLSPETVDRATELIDRLRPVALYGYTSMLEYVAREVLRRGLDSLRGSVSVAWNGAEMLFSEQSKLFEQAFGAPLLNFYGGRELSAAAHQTETAGPLWVLRPYLFLEIVDSNGRPVQPGESGRLIWTSTVCRGTPFLRYDVGDLGSCSRSGEDESGITAIAELQGRSNGLLELPNGQVVNCLYWNHFFKDYPEIQQFQVFVSRERTIELRFCGEGFTEKREEQLRQQLSRFLDGTPLRIVWMPQIPVTARGKLLQVLREDCRA